MMKVRGWMRDYAGIALALILILVLVSSLEGCAHEPKLYAEVGVKYAFPFSSDYWVHQDRSWTCDEPYQFEGELGYEFNNGWRGGLYHESFIACGSFNSKPEIFENGLVIRKKFGGHKP
jgi:hypothetical protein